MDVWYTIKNNQPEEKKEQHDQKQWKLQKIKIDS